MDNYNINNDNSNVIININTDLFLVPLQSFVLKQIFKIRKKRMIKYADLKFSIM